MAPRWTGMWGALDTKPPSGPNTAHEKSRRSLMLVEMEVLWRTLPICSVEEERWNTTEKANRKWIQNILWPRLPFCRSLLPLSLLPILAPLVVYLLCSWSGGRRWRAARCWAQCRGRSEGQSPRSYKHRPLLSDGPRSTAPPGWYWRRKEQETNLQGKYRPYCTVSFLDPN